MEILNVLSKATQLIKSGPGIPTQTTGFQVQDPFLYALVGTQGMEIRGDDSQVSGLSY